MASAEPVASAPAVVPPPELGTRLEQAAALRREGQLAEAEALYRALLAEAPGLWPTLVGLGLCARQQGDLAAAAEHLAAAVAAAPAVEHGVRLEYAFTLRGAGRIAEAETVYRALLAEAPGLWPALVGLGLCARQRGDLAAAAGHLAAALAAAPVPPEPGLRLEYAFTLREQGGVAAAEAAYRALLAEAPRTWQAMVGLASCARLRNDRAAGLAHLTAAIQAAPEGDDAAWFELADHYRDAGHLAQARAILRSRLERGAPGAQLWLQLGALERSAGDRAATLQAFREGQARHPERPQFALEIGIEEQALGHLAAAEEWLRRAAASDSLAGAALTHLGEIRRQEQQLEPALALLREAAPRPGAPVWVHALIAQTLADLGRAEEAFAALDEAEQRLGRRPDLACKRAYLLRRAGLRAEALAVCREAVTAAPAHFPLWYEWFENERGAGDAAGLDRCLAAAPVASASERAHLAHARGLVAEQRWQLEEAAAAFAEAVALDGSFGWMHEALARVSLLRCDLATARRHLLELKRLRAPQQRRQGLSPHLAHTPFGQILDEFLIDQEALARVAETLAAPPAARVGRLLALVRAAPDHTPTAIALLLALRQAGGFAPRRPAAGGGGIPARIVQYWNEAALPPDVAALMESWRACNPDWGYLRFDDRAAQEFLEARCAPEVRGAYLRAREPTMKADLFRLAYLFAEGGCYADADDRCLRPLAELVPPDANFLAWQEEFGTLGNNILAAAPLHPVLGRALDLAVLAVNRGDEDMLWLATGPGLLTRAFAQTLAGSALRPETWLERMAICDRASLERVVAIHCAAAYKHSPRHWTRAAPGQRKPAARNAGGQREPGRERSEGVADVGTVSPALAAISINGSGSAGA